MFPGCPWRILMPRKLSKIRRAKWRNIWAILSSLDRHEMNAVGLTVSMGFSWPYFRSDPHRYLMSTDDTQAELIWRAVEKRL